MCKNDFHFASCSALSHFVDDHELCDVSVSLFNVQLRCECITEVVLLETLLCEELVAWN